MDGAHLEHDEIIGTSREAFSDGPLLNQFRSQDVEDGFKHELHKCDPIALLDPFIDSVDARSDEMALICRGTTFQGPRDIIGLHEGEWLLIDVAGEKLMAVQVGAL